MKVHDDHLYHGAALIQIAEHPQFTAINSFKTGDGVSRSAFRINDDIGVYLKYASKPKKPFYEYQFTFQDSHLEELKEIANSTNRLYLALVCVEARHICALSFKKLLGLIDRRVERMGSSENQYALLVTMPANKAFRVYLNLPGKRKKMLGKPLLVPRNEFPGVLFQ